MTKRNHKYNWIGQTIGGRYQIEAMLGQGGMSTVYKATDPNLRRAVAIKLIHPHLSDDPAFVRRFEQEAAAVAQLRHPNIIQVYDFNHEENFYYMVLEYLPGETLQDRLARLNEEKERFALADTRRIMATVGDAVAYAHQHGLIHRDLKPANVMLLPNEQPILMDFGITKILGGTRHTATGAIVGTAKYMSPEQARGESLDERTDTYSLGVMLYEMVAGQPPFDADTAVAVLMKHVTEPVPDIRQLRADTPDELVTIVEKALAKKAEERYQTAAGMAAALRAIDPEAHKVVAAGAAQTKTVPEEEATTLLEDRPTLPTTGPRPAPMAAAPAGSKSNLIFWAVGAAAIVLLLLLGGLGTFFVVSRSGPAQESPAAAAGVEETETAPAEPGPASPETEEASQATADTPSPTAEEPEAGSDISVTPAAVSAESLATATSAAPASPTALTESLALNPTATAENTPVSIQTEPSPSPTPVPPTATSVPPTATPAPPTPTPVPPTPTSGPAPENMVLIPAGSFLMGSNGGPAEEGPEHEVSLDSFYLDKYEVSNAQYQQCVTAGGCSQTGMVDSFTRPGYRDDPAYAKYPVMGVTWNQVQAYCRWAGKRLPSEAEWEYGAAGPDNLTWPWGNSFDPGLGAASAADTQAVDSYPGGASAFGLHNMAGNVAEWVADLYDPTFYSRSPAENPVNTGSGSERVYRGGSFDNPDGVYYTTSRRYHNPPTFSDVDVGFRCAMDGP